MVRQGLNHEEHEEHEERRADMRLFLVLFVSFVVKAFFPEPSA
jgi:hypothetical protein